MLERRHSPMMKVCNERRDSFGTTKLMGNTVRFDCFNEHVCNIFPTFAALSGASKDDAVEMRVWQIDPTTERDV